MTTADGRAAASWQPGALPDQASVRLRTLASRLALPGAALALTATAASPLPWPIDLQFPSAPADAVTGFLPGRGVWQPIAQLPAPVLPPGQQIGLPRTLGGAARAHTLAGTDGALCRHKWGDPRFASARRPQLTFLNTLRSQSSADGTVLLYGRFTLDTQVHLYASVTTPQGTKVILRQRGSRLGWWLEGQPTKTLHALQLRPGALPIRVRLPARQLRASGAYTLRLAAVDPYGRRSQLLLSFTRTP